MDVTCPHCHKKDSVVVLETKIGLRRYACIHCDFEWVDKVSKEEETEFL